VATGRWTPGEQPQLPEQAVSAEVLKKLFNVTRRKPTRRPGTKSNAAICFTPWCSEDLPDGEKMKFALRSVGGVLVLFGVIWFLQGISVLPGSFMTGEIRWAVYGGIAVAAGIGLFLAANRR